MLLRQAENLASGDNSGLKRGDCLQSALPQHPPPTPSPSPKKDQDRSGTSLACEGGRSRPRKAALVSPEATLAYLQPSWLAAHTRMPLHSWPLLCFPVTLLTITESRALSALAL